MDIRSVSVGLFSTRRSVQTGTGHSGAHPVSVPHRLLVDVVLNHSLGNRGGDEIVVRTSGVWCKACDVTGIGRGISDWTVFGVLLDCERELI